MSKTKIIPLNDTIVIKRDPIEQNQLESGVIYDEGSAQPPSTGVVVSVGPGKLVPELVAAVAAPCILRDNDEHLNLLDENKDGDHNSNVGAQFRAAVRSICEGASRETRLPLSVKPGQRVAYQSFAGKETYIDGQAVVLIQEGDLIAILEPSDGEQ